MNLKELEDKISIMLTQFMVTFKKNSVLKGISSQFVVDDFGLIICCINRIDYAEINNAVTNQFKDWRVIYLTTNDSISDKRYEILWDLMRGGYMKWLRYSYPRQVRNILNGPENLGPRIIQERLRVWGDKPKFKYLVADNKVALKNGVLRELTEDPGFFDYMPEEN